MLKAGTRFGSFEVLARLGAGGMGEVWRARDTKLQREVAIKILPQDFASDPDRVNRFQREAQTLASLNHPNIAAIHDLQEIGGSRCLVLELVEGETLGERIRRGPIPIDESLQIAKQIADALEVAHEKGIVHRDLKPDNVKITPEGAVKVLDFGLAKVLEPSAETSNLANSPTVVSRTAGGVILGTPGYLSPEQARGKEVDKRSDIWAFGCVLYEMLTGRQMFSGETVSDIVAAVLTREVDWKDLPSNTPAKIRDLLWRCLQKNPKQRLRDIGDARLEIEDVLSGRVAPAIVATELAPAAAPPRSRWLIGVVILSLVVALAIGVLWIAERTNTPGSEWVGTLLGGPAVAYAPRVSPDGRLLAFRALIDGIDQVGVIDPDNGDWRILTKDRSHGYIADLSWSRDGSRIYYGRIDDVPRGIFSVSALGGDERLVLDDARSPETLPDGTLLVVRINTDRRNQIYRYWPETGRLQEYPAIPRGLDTAAIRAFKDGKEAIFVGRPIDQPTTDSKDYICSLDLNSVQVRRIEEWDDTGSGFAGFGLSVGQDDKSIIFEKQASSLSALMQIGRSGLGDHPQTLIATTGAVMGTDVATDGTIYIDQISRPTEFLQLATPASTPQRILMLNTPTVDTENAVMPDGRTTVTSLAGGRRRLLAGKPGESPVPFAQTAEETSGPAVMVGKDGLAFLIGRRGSQKLAIASAMDGRIIRRFDKIDGGAIQQLAAAPDGKTLYYAAGGKIWSASSSGAGDPLAMRDGDGVAVDRNGNYLIVQLNEQDGVRLVRLPLDGSPEQKLEFPGTRLAQIPISANAVRADGVIVKAVAVGTWEWSAALLHPDTGKVEPITLRSGFDVHYPGWTPDGQLVIAGLLTEGTLWRFKPDKQR